MSTQACMGGWCAKRAHCANYHATDRSEPVERLCMPGQDGIGLSAPVRMHRQAGSWERQGGEFLKPASPWDGLA